MKFKKNFTLIQSFKHDHSLHRTWFDAYILEKNQDCYILVTNNSLVMDYNGRKWVTKEPAVCFFYPDKWYNIIAMIRKNGIQYYCNIASPSIFDQEALKNIDYDLDIKVDANGKLYILDEVEYQNHAKKMNYSNDLKKILENALKELETTIINKKYPFNDDIIYGYYNQYLKELKNEH